ncbi:MAG: protein phosphatase [Nitrospirales bacterium]|nr:MAG: protein phosphatase [Nitrospirales bacterium]
MKWQGWGQTDIGRVRKINQDTFAIHPTLNLWIVADGMGGHSGGEVASQFVIETIGPFVEQQQANRKSLTIEDREHLLCDALTATNQAIRSHAREHPEYSGMGTTAVVLQITEDNPCQATIAHVGDSRAYLIQDDTITLLTRDHSLVEDRIDLGIITRDEALTHPLRHVLTKGLGIESSVEASVQTRPLQPTDKILLCSDGLTKMMTDNEFFNVIRQHSYSLKDACQQLVEKANRLGGDDNITVVLVGAEK